MSDAPQDLLLFGHGCPQHPEQGIARVVAEPTIGNGGGTLVTVEYACGHRHTQYVSGDPPAQVRDTAGTVHPVVVSL